LSQQSHANLTQRALAERVDVSRAYLSRLEMGRHDPPLSLLRRLAKALRVLTEVNDRAAHRWPTVK